MADAVSRETKSGQYIALIQRWQRSLSLTSQSDAATPRLHQHVETSRAIIPHLPAHTSRIIDLGSGQGFPAIPIAIETGILIDLIEADRRKAAFLVTAMGQLGLAGKVWPLRIEDAPVPPASCITARALAPLSTLIAWAKPLLQQGGCCLFLKGREPHAELEAARQAFDIDAEVLAIPGHGASLVKITRVR